MILGSVLNPDDLRVAVLLTQQRIEALVEIALDTVCGHHDADEIRHICAQTVRARYQEGEPPA